MRSDTQHQPTRVLVVEDEAPLREVVISAFRLAGFDARGSANGDDALRQHDDFLPQVLLLDVTIPGLSGLDICRALRSRGDRTPVIFLTARDALQDKLAGFELGADDYVTKPFSLEELVARVRAVIARVSAPVTPATIRYADLEMDHDAHTVRRAGTLVTLTPTEHRLLRFLIENAERVVTKGQILESVWGYDFTGDASVVENYISFLRRKIDHDGAKLIHTLRGVGYTMRLEQT